MPIKSYKPTSAGRRAGTVIDYKAELTKFTPEKSLLAREKVQELWVMLASLSVKQRTIFTMKFSEEMSIEEIATALGSKSTTVRTHLHRALKTVRARLGAKV